MRILILMNMYPPHSDGGYPLLCKETVDSLESRGHECIILTSYHQLKNPDISDSRIWRIFHYCPDNHQNELASYSLFDLFRWYSREQKEQNYIEKAITEFEPDAIFVWATKGMSYSIGVKLMQYGLPFFAYVCGYWLVDHNVRGKKRRQYQLWTWQPRNFMIRTIKELSRQLLRRYILIDFSPLTFDGIAINNLSVLEKLKKSPCEGEPCVIFDSAPIEKFAGIVPCDIQKPRRILFVGRLHPTKDPLTLIKACRTLLEQEKIEGMFASFC